MPPIVACPSTMDLHPRRAPSLRQLVADRRYHMLGKYHMVVRDRQFGSSEPQWGAE